MTYEFGLWLDAMIETHKVTAREIAKELGVNESTVSRMRRGVLGPSPETVSKLADIFGVDHLRLAALAGHIAGNDVRPLRFRVSPSHINRVASRIRQIPGLTFEEQQVLVKAYKEMHK